MMSAAIMEEISKNKRPCMLKFCCDDDIALEEFCLKHDEMNDKDNDDHESIIDYNSAKFALATPEIVENVLKFIEKKYIKNYRQVNRTFNEEICRCLQKSSYIHLEENSVEQMKSYAKILRSIRENKASSPFKRYYLIGKQLDSEFLDEILFEDESIIALRLNEAPRKNNSKFQKNLHKILTKNQSTLAALYCTLKSGVNLAWTGDNNNNDEDSTTSEIEGEKNSNQQKKNPNWYFPNLTEIEIVEVDDQSKEHSYDFLVSLINAAPNVVRFAPISNDENVVHEIMSKCDLSKVEDFYFPECTPRHVQLLSTLNIPNLTELAVCGKDESDDNIFTFESLQKLTGAFAKTLEVLLLNLPCNHTTGDYFPVCPRLKELRIGSFFGSLGIFSIDKFPRLKQITAFKVEYRNNIIRPHHGVEYFTLVCPTGTRSLSSIREAYEYFIYYLAQQFPNLRHLTLSCVITEEMLRLIITHLSKLKVLDITTESFFPENIFTGINKYQLWRCLSSNIHPSSQVKTPCFSDLKRLKTLSLRGCNQSVIGITNHAVEYGLANCMKLKHLKLDWAPDLSVAIVSQHLSHLQTLTINNPLDFFSEEIKARLREAMPSVIIC